MMGTHTTDRAMVMTRTMCGVVGNPTKGLSSRYHNTIAPLDERTFSLNVDSNTKGTIHLLCSIIAHLKKKSSFFKFKSCEELLENYDLKLEIFYLKLYIIYKISK